MTTLLQDVRYGLRMLAKDPGFTAVAVLTLALSIGTNTAMFSVVNSAILRPLPFPHSDRIVQMLKQYKDGTGSSISVPLFDYWHDHNQVFDGLAAFDILPIGFNLANSGEAERVPGVRVTAGFFRVLGIKPALGREFLREEDSVGGPHAVILSYGLWQGRFAGDTALLGQPITINGEKYTVVGIMPPGFDFPAGTDFSSGTEVWIPFQLPTVSHDPANFLVCIGRLKPGTSGVQAQNEMSRVTQEFHRTAPDLTASDERAALVPLRERLVGHIRPALLTLLGAVGLVLLIACANVANLFVTKSTARVKELAIRTALGASRFRVTSQLLAEAVLLSLLGGLLGLALAFAVVPVLTSLGPPDLRQLGTVAGASSVSPWWSPCLPGSCLGWFRPTALPELPLRNHLGKVLRASPQVSPAGDSPRGSLPLRQGFRWYCLSERRCSSRLFRDYCGSIRASMLATFLPLRRRFRKGSMALPPDSRPSFAKLCDASKPCREWNPAPRLRACRRNSGPTFPS